MQKADRDHAEQRDDQRLDPAEALVLEIEDQEHVERGDEDADLERNAEDQVEADRGADHLGEVGGDDRDFGEDQSGQATARGKASRQAWARSRPVATARRAHSELQHDRHDVGEQRDEEQRVAELGAAGERGRPVAGVHVADGDEIAGAEEGERPSEGRTLRRHGDGAVDLGQ